MRTQPDSWARVVLVMSLVMPWPVECPPGRQMPPLISTATCASGQAKSARKRCLRDLSPSCFWYEAQVSHAGRMNSRWKGRPGQEISHWLAKASSRWLGIGALDVWNRWPG